MQPAAGRIPAGRCRGTGAIVLEPAAFVLFKSPAGDGSPLMDRANTAPAAGHFPQKRTEPVIGSEPLGERPPPGSRHRFRLGKLGITRGDFAAATAIIAVAGRGGGSTAPPGAGARGRQHRSRRPPGEHRAEKPTALDQQSSHPKALQSHRQRRPARLRRQGLKVAEDKRTGKKWVAQQPEPSVRTPLTPGRPRNCAGRRPHPESSFPAAVPALEPKRPASFAR